MTTYARIVSGLAVDVRVHATATELEACFTAAWLAAHPFTVVPDGTIHGAKDNGNGTFSNPTPPSVSTVDLFLDRKALRAHVTNVFGGGGAGTAKLQGYIDTAIADTATTAAGQNRRYALDALRQEETFSKTEAQQVMTALQFSGADKTAVLNAWPFVTVT